MMKKIRTLFISFFLLLILILATVTTWVYSQINSSLPKLNGKETLWGLTNTTVIERDKQGIVTIKGKTRTDVALATGFVHAQERFFQMDLLRRNSAGELSSLFGKIALNYDKKIRRHRFRDRARAIVKQLPKEQIALLKAYTQGVNQGLKTLDAVPFEYLLLRQDPVEWQEEDTILTVFSMYIDLQYHDGKRERTLAILNKMLSKKAFAFLNPKGSIWDAAIDGSQYSPSTMPSNHWLKDFAKKEASKQTFTQNQQQNQLMAKTDYQGDYIPGSNNWAVSGKLTSTGSAMVANDMHLNIRVPNTWFRASFEYPSSIGEIIKITGATLPGTPNIVVGSNGHIAWGFTNSYGDWSDIITLELSHNKQQYLTPTGYKNFTYSRQVIAVKDQPSVEIEIKETIWGPVIGKNQTGQPLAYRWVAHDLQAVNLAHTQLEQAQNIDDAFAIAAISGIPAQNMMVADSQGNIGWTIMGPIPRKKGNVGILPSSWASGKNGWQGYLPANEYPQVKNPQNNRLWTANTRVIGGELLEKLGNGGYALGARASQIRDDLFAKKSFNEQDLLNIALDDRALFLTRWKTFLSEQVLTLANIAQHPNFIHVQQIIASEQQQTFSASINSVVYRLVRDFRINVRNSVFDALNKKLSAYSASYNFRSIQHQIETPLWELITKQPDNFLANSKEQGNGRWQTLFNNALAKTITDMTKNLPLSQATWGQANTSTIVHPLSKAVPFIGKWLNMPATPLPGDSYMPRVQGKAFGASERMVVSPGHEENGIFNMPTSQSGHPWSPYYGMGHSDWEQGKPSSFLPGKTKYTLTLLSY
jgi:penicillin amidase